MSNAEKPTSSYPLELGDRVAHLNDSNMEGTITDIDYSLWDHGYPSVPLTVAWDIDPSTPEIVWSDKVEKL